MEYSDESLFLNFSEKSFIFFIHISLYFSISLLIYLLVSDINSLTAKYSICFVILFICSFILFILSLTSFMNVSLSLNSSFILSIIPSVKSLNFFLT